jgi:hypothetical protein
MTTDSENTYNNYGNSYGATSAKQVPTSYLHRRTRFAWVFLASVAGPPLRSGKGGDLCSLR